jgi:hypothetical protein
MTRALVGLAACCVAATAGAQKPVVPDPTRFERVLAWPGAHWQNVDTEHFRLYTEPGTYAARHLREAGERAESAWRDDLALIGELAYQPRINVFYFESAARMDSVFEMRGTGLTFPEAQLVMLVMGPGRDSTPDDRHEIMHVISVNLWGWNAEQAVWQREGLANVASMPDWPYTIDQMAEQARRDGDQRTVADLTGPAFFAGERIQRFRAYMLASSFVEYLLLAGGGNKFRQLWQQGLGATYAIYGYDLTELARQWEANLRTVPMPAGGINLAHVMECACR